MIQYAIFLLLSTGAYVQTSVPPFNSLRECESRLAEINIKDTRCLELNVAVTKPTK